MATPCAKCNGEQKLDSEKKKPWSQADRKQVLAGNVLTIVCDQCKGSGVADEELKPNK